MPEDHVILEAATAELNRARDQIEAACDTLLTALNGTSDDQTAIRQAMARLDRIAGEVACVEWVIQDAGRRR